MIEENMNEIVFTLKKKSTFDKQHQLIWGTGLKSHGLFNPQNN